MIEQMATELALILGGSSKDWVKYELICRRVLEHARHPTDEMCKAVGRRNGVQSMRPDVARAMWTKMMDVALRS